MNKHNCSNTKPRESITVTVYKPGYKVSTI